MRLLLCQSWSWWERTMVDDHIKYYKSLLKLFLIQTPNRFSYIWGVHAQYCTASTAECFAWNFPYYCPSSFKMHTWWVKLCNVRSRIICENKKFLYRLSHVRELHWLDAALWEEGKMKRSLNASHYDATLPQVKSSENSFRDTCW